MTDLANSLAFPTFWNVNTFNLRHIANRVALLESYRDGHVSAEGHPVVLQIEIANRSSQAQSTREVVDMELDLFQRIIDETHPWAELAVLHLSGDPLKNADLPAMITYAAQHGVHTVLVANAESLPDAFRAKLIACGLDVVALSLPGSGDTPDEHIALEHARCDRPWFWLTVFADGTLATCHRDTDGAIRLPNLRDHSVQDAWNGPAMRTFRATHNKGRSCSAICKSCDYSPLLHRSATIRLASCLFDQYSLHRLLSA